MKQYKIIEHKHFNKYGVCDSTIYYILSFQKFFFWHSESYISCWGYDPESRYRVKISFKTMIEARLFVENILIPNKPRETTVKREVYSTPLLPD